MPQLDGALVSGSPVPQSVDHVVQEVGDAMTLAEHCEYRVMQTSLFKKPGVDPAAGKIVRLKGQVGSTVCTTGRSWTGLQGGKWVELDTIVEKPGWLLVEGPGFGVPGPLLQKIDPGDEEAIVLCVVKPDGFDGTRQWRQFVLGRHSKASEAKLWIALLFGLDPTGLIICAASGQTIDPSQMSSECPDGLGIGTYYLRADKVLTDSMSMYGAGYRDGDEVQYVYYGDLSTAGEGKEPCWAKEYSHDKLPHPDRKLAKPVMDSFPELREHFFTLELHDVRFREDIKRHYRRLALACHPDKHPDDVDRATKKFQEIKAAYEILRDKLQL